MKKCSFLITFAIAASTFIGTSHLAYADGSSDDEVLPPIVFLLLDTSGSMNEIFDEDTNNTRLTNALGEIIGGFTYKDSSNKIIRADCGNEFDTGTTEQCREGGEEFDMPFPNISRASGLPDKARKTIPKNSKIAKPKDRDNYTDVDRSYDQNGIIQQYQKSP